MKKRIFKINLDKTLTTYDTSMMFIEETRKNLCYNDIDSIEVQYNGLGWIDLSANIHGFIFELISQCRSRGIELKMIKREGDNE